MAGALLALVVTAGCNIPAYVQHRELRRELGSVQQGHYSVHLLWEETAGGAVGPHGVSLEQRMVIAPGLYMVKTLDYFAGANEGSISVEGTDRIEVHISRSGSDQELERVYSLKHRVFF